MKSLARPARPILHKKRQGECPPSDATFRILFANNPLALWVYDLETLRFLDVNEVACHNYGYTRDEFLAMSIRDIRPEEDIPQVNVSVLTTDEHTFNSGIWRHRKKDGNLIRVEIHSHEIVYEGRRARFVCPLDVTDRLRADEARENVAALLREREAGLRRAQIVAKLAHVITRPDGSFESWSETLPQLIGVEPEAVPKSTREWLKIVHPDDRAAFRSIAIEAAKSGVRKDVEYRLLRPDGAWIDILEVVEPIQSGAGARWSKRWFGTLQDITEQKRAAQRIQRLNRVYAVLSGINSLLVRVRDRDELFRDACRIAVDVGHFPFAWLGMVDRVGKRVQPVVWTGEEGGFLFATQSRRSLEDNPPEGHGPAARAVLERKAIVVHDVLTDPWIVRKREHLDLDIRSMAALPLIVSNEVVGVLALHARETGFFDEEEMKLLSELAADIAFALQAIEKQEKLDYISYYDTLTGLPNRTLFIDRASQGLRAGSGELPMLALILLNIERFRNINETLGRHGGDELLKLVARRLESAFQGKDSLARTGADGFGLVLRGLRDTASVVHAIEGPLQGCFKELFRLNGTELLVAVRAGVAIFPADGGDADTLFRNAEAALKKAKDSGERYLFYSADMNARAAQALSLETRLRKAVEAQQFVLHYQPKVNLSDGKLRGLEALIRWQEPGAGLVVPGAFIPVLEDTGLILEVGKWVLGHALAQHQEWAMRGLAPPRIAVNVSAIQLQRKDFADMVIGVVQEHGDNPDALELEVTESLMLKDMEAGIRKLSILRGLGIHVAMDDFGTGYSSLSYVAKLPIDSMKIDRAFITGMADNTHDMAIAKTIIALAHSLNLRVVAEGVETEDQSKLLRQLNCDEAQGYFFCKPLPAHEIEPLLAACR